MANDKNNKVKKAYASTLSINPVATAFHNVVSERWDNWDLNPFLAYLVDTCASSALPYLAEQFDVDGLKGLSVAENEEQQRELIKRSIALHKLIGTPWAIKEACRTVGFTVILEEGVTEVPGGPSSPDDWARFRVIIDVDENRSISEAQGRNLKLFIEEYKNERSHLVAVGFRYAFIDDEDIFRIKNENNELLTYDLIIAEFDSLVDDVPNFVVDDDGFALSEILY